MWNSYRTGAPQKIKNPRKLPEKWTFLSLAFYNAPSLHTDVLWTFWTEGICTLSGLVSRDAARLSQGYPPIARYGVSGVSTWPIGCDTPSLFSEAVPPWRACEVEVRYPPPPHKRGSSAILARYRVKTQQKRAIPPSAMPSGKGIARKWRGISHWAA